MPARTTRPTSAITPVLDRPPVEAITLPPNVGSASVEVADVARAVDRDADRAALADLPEFDGPAVLAPRRTAEFLGRDSRSGALAPSLAEDPRRPRDRGAPRCFAARRRGLEPAAAVVIGLDTSSAISSRTMACMLDPEAPCTLDASSSVTSACSTMEVSEASVIVRPRPRPSRPSVSGRSDASVTQDGGVPP